MQDVFKAIGKISKTDITVLIRGESGTGKELIAQSVHTNSPRSDKPFVAINVAAILMSYLKVNCLVMKRFIHWCTNTEDW